MIGKIVFCSAICLFLSQVCLAEYNSNKDEVSLFGLSFDGACKDSVKEIGGSIKTTCNSTRQYFRGIKQGIVDFFGCFKTGQVVDCVKTVIKSTHENSKLQAKKIVQDIRGIKSTIANAVKTCLQRPGMLFIEPLLLHYLGPYMS